MVGEATISRILVRENLAEWPRRLQKHAGSTTVPANRKAPRCSARRFEVEERLAGASTRGQTRRRVVTFAGAMALGVEAPKRTGGAAQPRGAHLNAHATDVGLSTRNRLLLRMCVLRLVHSTVLVQGRWLVLGREVRLTAGEVVGLAELKVAPRSENLAAEGPASGSCLVELGPGIRTSACACSRPPSAARK